MVGISGSTPQIQKPMDANFLAAELGWKPADAQSFLDEVDAANTSGDVNAQNRLNDIFDKAIDAASQAKNVTEAPQTGVTAAGGATASGSGFSPATAPQRLDPAALKVGNSPSPMDRPLEAVTPEMATEAVGDPALDPSPGLPTTIDTPARPVSEANAGADAALKQKVAPADGSTATPPQAKPDGPFNRIDNNPGQIAQRLREGYQKQGLQAPDGKGWDNWQANTEKEIGQKWDAMEGVFDVNPELMAKQVADKCKAAGTPLTEDAQKVMEASIHNHFVKMNGGLLCTGGQLREFTQQLTAGIGQANAGAAQASQMQQMMMAAQMQGANPMLVEAGQNQIIGGSVLGRVICSLGGAGVGAMIGSAFLPPIGTLIGGYLGSKAGNAVGALASGGAVVNPMMMMGGNPLQNNVVGMGMGAGLSTVGMLGSNMMGGGMTPSPGGAFMSSLMNGGSILQATERGSAASTSWQYQAMNQETRLKRLMTKQAMVSGDQDMVRMLTSSNMPIEKLVAMWSLKNCGRYEKELKDKMLAAEDARQREKIEENNQQSKSGSQGMMGGLLSTGASIAGFALGGPVGGMIGGAVGGMAGQLVNQAGNAQQQGDGGAMPESAAALQLEVQMSLEEWKRSYELASNILKSLNDMAMTAINNTRV
jgi:hypothetical protein